MKNSLKILVPVLLLSLGGCDKIPGFGGKPPQPESQAASMARANPTAGAVETVTVTAQGRGPTAVAAADQAIRMAIDQVNGKAVEASSMQMNSGTALAVGGQAIDVSSSSFADMVASQTSGVVTGFKVLEQKTDRKGMVDITIEASVTKFVRPESAKRLRIAVAPLRTAAKSYPVDLSSVDSGEIAQRIRQDLIAALTKTNRVALLDRDFSAEVDAEIERIGSGKVAREESARIGQQLATDYVLVGRIENFGYQRHEQPLRMSGKVLVSHSGGASLSLRLINVATGQTEMTESVSLSLPRTEPTTLGTSINTARIIGTLAGSLSEQATQKLVFHLFPITVVSLDGQDVVLSQGGDALFERQFYEVIARGQEIIDPQTGLSLGRVEKPCCVIEVTRVTPQLSYGRIASSQIDVAAAFAPGALELTGSMVPPPRAAVAVAGAGTAPAAASASRSASKPAPAAAPKKTEPPAPPAETLSAPAEDPNW